MLRLDRHKPPVLSVKHGASPRKQLLAMADKMADVEYSEDMNTTTAPVTSIHCPTCGHDVSVAHVTDSYTCRRAADMTPADADR
jgi:hypothetical protein